MKKCLIHTLYGVLIPFLLLSVNAYGLTGKHFYGTPEHIKFKEGQAPSIGELMTVMNNYGFQYPAGLSLLGAETDILGMVHYRYTETYYGHPVNTTMWIAHTRNGKIESMNGLLYAKLPSPAPKTIDVNVALNNARQFVPATEYYNEPAGGELYWALPDNSTSFGDFRLCYRFDIYAAAPLARQYVFVDVANGKVITAENRIHEANTPGTAVTAYNGTQSFTTDAFGSLYRLRETGRGNGIETYNLQKGINFSAAVDFTDTDNTWNNVNANLDQYATDVHWGVEKTYDFYKNTLNRNSVDNAGMKLVSYVHYSSSYLNAFWDGKEMVFGDGSPGYTPLTALDITGHEMSHGVTSFTSNLKYQYESGALNEGFSDCMGTAVEFYGKTSGANWTMGENIGSAFRDMANPNKYQQPDTYHGNYWYYGASDNGGVHTNSGVLNYWFYLLSNGGSGVNDIGNSFNVNNISMAKAVAILYRTQSVYLFPLAQFKDAATLSIQAATDLYGSCSPEVIAVADAWYAVGVGTKGASAAITIVASPGATVCPATTVTFTATPVNGGSAPAYQWKVNGVNMGTNSPTYVSSALVTGDKVTCVLTSNASCVGTPVATSNVITMTVSTLPVSVSITVNPGTTICTGSQVIFTAKGTNGGSAPTYQWKVKGVNVGTGGTTYTTTSLANGDIVTCVLTSSISCASGNPATSNALTITVSPCTGLNVSFTTSKDTVLVNEADTLVNTSSGYSDFLWNFCSSVPKDSPVVTDLGSPGGKYKVCAFTSLAEDNGQFYSFTSNYSAGEIVMGNYGNSFQNAPTATVVATGLGGQMEGIQVAHEGNHWLVFTLSNSGLNRTDLGPSLATPTAVKTNLGNPGGFTYGMDLQLVHFQNTWYGFMVNNVSGYFIRLDFGASLLNTPTATLYSFPSAIGLASGILVRYNPLNNHFLLFVCSYNPNTLARFDLGTSPGGIPTFVDKSPLYAAGSEFRDITIIQECDDVYGLAAYKGSSEIVKFHFLNNNISASYVSIYPLPQYTGKVSSPHGFSEFFNADTTSASRVMFITNESGKLVHMDFDRCLNSPIPSTRVANPGPIIIGTPGTYTITLTGGIGTCYEQTYCKTIYVKPCFSATTASVSVAVTPGDTICLGTSVTFTATPTNGGSAPIYNWKVNGANVGTNNPVYTSSALSNNDLVTCEMISSEPCITGSPAEDSVLMIVITPQVANVAITASPGSTICPGTTVTFTATSTNGGALSFQWKLNGLNVGTNSPAYTNPTLLSNDKVSCVMTPSSSCITGGPATSNIITIVVNPASLAGTILSPRDSICAGTPNQLTLVGSSGTPIQWQSSLSSTGFANIAGANDTFYLDVPAQTIYYRAIVGVGNCPDTSAYFNLIVLPAPFATFTSTASGLQVTFNSSGSSGGITSYNWIFDDGGTSNQANPVHVYAANGAYNVCLTVYNGSNCSFTFCKEVTVAGSVGIASVGDVPEFKVYPNPVVEQLTIDLGDFKSSTQYIELYDVLGRLRCIKAIREEKGNTIQMDVSEISSGIYYLKIKTNETSYVIPVVKE